MSLRLMLRLLGREVRGARARLLPFLASLAIGVAAVVLVAGLGDSVSRAVRMEARPLLGADVSARASRPLPDLKAGAGRRTAADAYRIETASTGELLVVRESERVAKLNVAETIAAGPGRLWLRAFVDQDTGRLALTLA